MIEIYFNKFFKIANYCSIFLIIISVLLLFFKGLNFGVDFRGGTLIELRVNDKNINITTLRDYCKEINLDGVTITSVTGHSGKFIVENKIGVGTIVKLNRSGGTIPNIMKVLKPSSKALLPAISNKLYNLGCNPWIK